MNFSISTTILRRFSLAIFALLTCVEGVQANGFDSTRLLAFADDSCRGWQTSRAPAEGYTEFEVDKRDLRFGDLVVGDRYRLPLAEDALLELDVVMRGGR